MRHALWLSARSVPLGTARHRTTRNGTARRAVRTPRYVRPDFSSMVQSNESSDIDMGMRRIDSRRARSPCLFGHRSRSYRTAATAYGSGNVAFRPIRENGLRKDLVINGRSLPYR